jgi:deoxyadenosine/deoxycytidine kinase
VSDLSYVAVEGVIGVGKTTLARMVAERLDAELILETAEENPFLPKFYQDPRRYAFQTQVFFLLSRYHQLGQLAARDLFAQRIVCDYLFDKDGLFASVNLSEPELLLYEKIVPLMREQLPRPDLVVYLQARTEVLLDRIRRRKVPYERQIGRDYLEALNAAYNYFFFHYDQTPLLVVKTDEIDFVHRPEHFEDLLHQIERSVDGKQYYVPAP